MAKLDNPVDEYLSEREKVSSKLKIDDTELVKQWQAQNQSGQVDPVLQEQVFSRFEPVRRAAVSKYKAPLTPAGFDTKSRALLASALTSWDPNRGAAPATHITGEMRRLYRENLQQQSVQNTEADAGLFGTMDAARTEFIDEFDRDPTPEEHLVRMNEMLPKNKRINAERFKQVQSRRGGVALSSGFEATPMSTQISLEKQTLEMLPYQLNDQEKNVYNHLFGRGGARATESTNEIAAKLGLSPSKVSRLRKSIAMKAGVHEEHLTSKRRTV